MRKARDGGLECAKRRGKNSESAVANGEGRDA